MTAHDPQSDNEAQGAMRVVVVGGVAAGMSAASQAKRRKADAEVVVLERGPHVSYAACGMPYNIEDAERQIDDLIVIDAERFRRERGIDVRVRHEVRAVDPEKRSLQIRDLTEGKDYSLAYDRLIIATGAEAVRLPVEGAALEGVFVLRELEDGARLKDYVARRACKSALIVGAGYIGVEMAEALRGRGLHVTMLEKAPQVLPGFDAKIAALVHAELTKQGVVVESSSGLTRIERAGDSLRVLSDRGEHRADLVLIAVGVRPNVRLATAAGIQLGPTGAIAVDDAMRTNIPGVFAAGDCAEAKHLVSGQPAYIPLGTTANKQGKVAGANAVGAQEIFRGIVGSAGFKAFDLEVARTGLGAAEITRLGIDALRSESTHTSRAHGYPGAVPLTTVLFAETQSGKLLGAQMVGAGTVAKRIDVFAAALYAGMTLDDVEALDLSYAPPFAPVYDPILIAATVALKDRDKALRRR